MQRGSQKSSARPPSALRSFEQLCDVGGKRIAEMDAAKIDMQVFSLTSPGAEQVEATDAIALAREANDFLADAQL
jgi:uncharacterized protein